MSGGRRSSSQLAALHRVPSQVDVIAVNDVSGDSKSSRNTAVAEKIGGMLSIQMNDSALRSLGASGGMLSPSLLADRRPPGDELANPSDPRIHRARQRKSPRQRGRSIGHETTDQKPRALLAQTNQAPWRVPHTCHTPRYPAVSHGHSRALPHRGPGLSFSTVAARCQREVCP